MLVTTPPGAEHLAPNPAAPFDALAAAVQRLNPLYEVD
jgi:hypothetical protein